MATSSAPITHKTLKNGMQVVIIPDHRAPVVTHMVWYRNGAADDPPRKSGIAHFLEHLMFKGTKAHPAGEFSKTVTELGGNENAFTGNDYTAYYQSVAKQHLGRMMAFEADRMTNLALTDKVVIPERDVVLEERRMHVDNEPANKLDEALYKSLFTHHPYGNPVIGWEHEIASLDRKDALAYYKRFYTPENAILVVAGDVEPAETLKLAARTYGKVPARSAPPVRERPQEPPPRSARLVRLADPRVEQPRLRRLYLVPSYNRAAEGEAEALEVAAQLLGAEMTGLLYRRLVVEKGVAVHTSAWYHGETLDASHFGVHAVPADTVTLPELEAAIDTVIAEFSAAPPPARDLARAKTRLVAYAIYMRDSQSTMARAYGAALCTGGRVEDVADWPNRIEAVTAEAVQKVAAAYLTKMRSTTGYLESAPKDATL